MLCKKCFNSLNEEIKGQKSGNSTALGISLVPSGQLVFSNNFIPVYIQTERLVTKGKNKGETVKGEVLQYFKSKFCPKCGEKFEEDKQ